MLPNIEAAAIANKLRGRCMPRRCNVPLCKSFRYRLSALALLSYLRPALAQTAPDCSTGIGLRTGDRSERCQC
jgi:hypothetical protein